MNSIEKFVRLQRIGAGLNVAMQLSLADFLHQLLAKRSTVPWLRYVEVFLTACSECSHTILIAARFASKLFVELATLCDCVDRRVTGRRGSNPAAREIQLRFLAEQCTAMINVLRKCIWTDQCCELVVSSLFTIIREKPFILHVEGIEALFRGNAEYSVLAFTEMKSLVKRTGRAQYRDRMLELCTRPDTINHIEMVMRFKAAKARHAAYELAIAIQE